MNFTVYYQNIRSILGKKKRTKFINNCEVQSNPVDVIAITETWLDETVPDSNIFFKNYSFIRVDRNKKSTNKKKGGGIMLAFNNSLDSYNIIKQNNEKFERLDVLVNKCDKKYFISLVYFPPNLPSKFYNHYCNEIMSCVDKNQFSNIFIIGDFNLPCYNWINVHNDYYLNGHNKALTIKESAKSTFNLIKKLNLKQYNSYINPDGNTLDLFLSNNHNNVNVEESIEPLSKIDTAHSAHLICFKSSIKKFIKTPDKYYLDYSHADFNAIKSNLNAIDWSNIYNNFCNVTKFLEYLYDILYYNIEKYIPKKYPKHCKYPNYFSSELKNCIYQKRKMHCFYKTFYSSHYYDAFQKLRKKCKLLIQRDYNDMINKLCKDANQEPNKIWKFLSNNKTKTYPTEFFLNKDKSFDNQSTADLFAKHFSSSFVNSNLKNYNLNITNIPKLDNILITSTDISKAINSIKLNNSHGPDLISASLIHNCKTELLQPLLLLFSGIIDKDDYPSKLKMSHVVPVYKSNDKNNIGNYRPITIINNFAKILDKIIFEKINNSLYDLIIPEQHGGIPGRSTVTNLLCFNEYVSDAFLKNNSVQAMYLDVSKAFDTVNHQLLCYKLEKYGISGNLLNYFKNYLSNRTQAVKFCNTFSSPYSVVSGIPQGSVLACLLYLLYVNDIKLNIRNAKFLLFVDDLKVYLEINDYDDLHLLLSDLNSILLWAKNNGLNFNFKKCYSMLFSKSRISNYPKILLNDVEIPNLHEAKDLGIYYQNNLLFDNHINIIIKKAIRNINYIKYNCRKFKNIKILINIYNCIVKSILMYGSCLWNPTKKGTINDLEKIQQKFLRFLSYKTKIPMKYNQHDYAPILSLTKLNTLKVARAKNDLKFIYRLKNGIINCDNFYDVLPFFESRNQPRKVSPNPIFITDNKKIPYSALHRMYNLPR